MLPAFCWGHTIAVADAHYLQIPDEEYEQALAGAEQAKQNAKQSVTEWYRQEQNSQIDGNSKNLENPDELRVDSKCDENSTHLNTSPRGTLFVTKLLLFIIKRAAKCI